MNTEMLSMVIQSWFDVRNYFQSEPEYQPGISERWNGFRNLSRKLAEHIESNEKNLDPSTLWMISGEGTIPAFSYFHSDSWKTSWLVVTRLEARITTLVDAENNLDIAVIDDSEPLANGAQGLSKEALAIAALKDHPDWTHAEIAKAAGCHKGSLHRFKDYMAARELLARGKEGFARGYKTTDGRIEAWDRE